MSRALRVSSVRLVLLFLVAGLSACGGGDTWHPDPMEPITVGEVLALLDASSGVDSDKDGVPDDVELNARIGTDPNDEDSDGDGVIDAFEIFGRSFIFVMSQGRSGTLHGDDLLLDVNENRLMAAIDPDEWAEQYQIDSDGDGVCDWMEWYGYTYDWLQGKFVPWSPASRAARPAVRWFRTDALQASTDQDPYPDGMEASGLMMDVAVKSPGDNPLVPARPNIVVKLVGYQITLNDDVTYEEGGSITEGESWSRETESSNTTSHSVSATVGGEAGLEISATGPTLGFEVQASVTYGFSTSHTTSVSVAHGMTFEEQATWNVARCHNATQAALIKLMLKVENHGTSPVSNLVPTINLVIGGAAAATFRPSNLQVNMLMPGESYPPGEDDFLVVDNTENGPLYLTDWELRALESGAPVHIAVPQVDGDVMRMTEDAGWESIGAIGEYLGRCEAVCANLFADLGDGEFLHQRVYAGDGPAAPVVTLRDALRWALGATEENDDVYLEQRMADGSTQKVKITTDTTDVWTVHVDPLTRQGFEPGVTSLLDAELMPESNIQIIPPRTAGERAPRIYSAYAVPLAEGGTRVVACANDFDGIETIVLVDRNGVDHEMSRDGRGPWFYACTLDPTYQFVGNLTELVRATSQNPDVAVGEQHVELIYTVISMPPVVRPPFRYDMSNRIFQARVEAGSPLPQDAVGPGSGGWVRLYNDLFIDDTQGLTGFLEMTETDWLFTGPNWYKCRLPQIAGRLQFRDYGDCLIVARSAGGDYVIARVEADEVQSVGLFGFGDLKLECYTDYDAWVVWQTFGVAVDLDQAGEHFPRVVSEDGSTVPYDGGDWVEEEGKWPSDTLEPFISDGTRGVMYLRSKTQPSSATSAYFGAMPGYWGARLDTPAGKSDETFFAELTRNTILAMHMGALQEAQSGAPVEWSSETGIYIFQTPAPDYRLIKVHISGVEKKYGHILGLPNWARVNAQGQYVVYHVQSIKGTISTDLGGTYSDYILADVDVSLEFGGYEDEQKTDSTGFFKFTGLDTSSYSLTFEKAGFVTEYLSTVPSSTELTIGLAPLLEGVTATVKDASSTGVSGAVVTAEDTNGNTWTATTAASGEASLTLPTGTYTFTAVEGSDNYASPATTTIVGDGDPTTPIGVTLTPAP